MWPAPIEVEWLECRDSNPDFRVQNPASCRLDDTPKLAAARGFEPRSAGSGPAVLPIRRRRKLYIEKAPAGISCRGLTIRSSVCLSDREHPLPRRNLDSLLLSLRLRAGRGIHRSHAMQCSCRRRPRQRDLVSGWCFDQLLKLDVAGVGNLEPMRHGVQRRSKGFTPGRIRRSPSNQDRTRQVIESPLVMGTGLVSRNARSFPYVIARILSIALCHEQGHYRQ